MGTKVRRVYEAAQTPYERLSARSVMPEETSTRLDTIFTALDPLRLLDQIGQLQAAVWQHNVVRTLRPVVQEPQGTVRFVPNACGITDHPPTTAAPPPPIVREKRMYRHQHVQLPRWWRTRIDPFAEGWSEIEGWLTAQPERTAASIMTELQQRYPDLYPSSQLRTLHRRIALWRASVITTFDDQWLHEEVFAEVNVSRPLRAAAMSERTETGEVV